MKKLLLLNLMLFAFSAPVQAATVKAFATNIITKDGDFSEAPGGTALSDSALQNLIVNKNINTAVYGESTALHSDIDLGFDSPSVFTGSGVDLVIYSLWQGVDYSFALEVYGKKQGDTEGELLSAYTYLVTGAECAIPCSPTVLTKTIDIFNNDATPTALENNIELGYLRLFVGGDLATGGLGEYSNFSLVGAFNTEITQVLKNSFSFH